MLVSRVLSRIPKTALAQCRTSLLVSTSKQNQQQFSTLSNHFHSLHESPDRLATWLASLLHNSTLGSAFQRCWISSSASPEPNKKETSQTGSEDVTNLESRGAAATNAEAGGDSKVIEQTEGMSSADATSPDQTEESGSTTESQTQSVKRRRGGVKRTAFSDSDSEDELSMNDLVKLVAEKEKLLKIKQKEIETMQDKVLRSYAEMENVMDRTRREAENSKKFAIQNFAKGLLDVADNLGRASAVVKESFSKIDASKDTAGAVPLLKTLLEGVDMTDKQLAEVFKKFGVEKYDPMNEQFDPHRHNAVFQMPDGSKPPGTVAAVLKSGYMLYDRVIRPAEVGVTQAVEDNDADQQGSEA